MYAQLTRCFSAVAELLVVAASHVFLMAGWLESKDGWLKWLSRPKPPNVKAIAF